MASDVAPEQLDAFLRETAGGKSMREICRQAGMPTRWQIQEALRNDAAFASQYARACEMRSDDVFDEIFEISDDDSKDVQHRRLQVDTRKWALARMNPRKYGDKLALHGDKTLDPIQSEQIPPAEILKARLAAIRSRTDGALDADAD